MRLSLLALLLGCNSGIDATLTATGKGDEEPDPCDDPQLTEIAYDGLDNDCDPSTPDDDLDGDGRPLLTDCDDANDAIGGNEVAYDGLDNDCDPSTPDDDLDGDGVLLASDCDDTDASVFPGATERCDSADNDCDGAVDEEAIDAVTVYPDADADSYGDPSAPLVACAPPDGFVLDNTDCDDTVDSIHPLAEEQCNAEDDDCDSAVDEDGVCPLSHGGHRVDKGGDYYYALYSDPGVGILGSTAWYGSGDAANGPEGVTWNQDQTLLYYNDLMGNVFEQTPPFTARSRHVGTFSLGQVGGGVIYDGNYYVGDYANGDIYVMNIATGLTSRYADRGSSATKPYFGNSSMSIDVDGKVYAASSGGIIVYSPGSSAVALNSLSGLRSAVAMDASQELYALTNSGAVLHIDKSSGAVLDTIYLSSGVGIAWTLAVDGNGDFLVNDWGRQRLFDGSSGAELRSWDSSTFYPGTTGYYWYVTF